MTELQQQQALPAAEMPTLATTATATATTTPTTPTGPPTPDTSSSGGGGGGGSPTELTVAAVATTDNGDVAQHQSLPASPTTPPAEAAAPAAAHPAAATQRPSPPSATPPPPARRFICGVVEGFYGRPWTTEQRKDLFSKLRTWGMDSYVYAPKDDYKHRAYWRELYTVEEGDHLAGLIAAAREHNITFYYALSPGLDMTYSNPREVAALKRKLEQVSQLGCSAFALLFDDIESEMSKPDKDVFQTFAHAQVTVTNEIYRHLGAPRFLFCPTQYCATRAVPTVSASDYLLTLGAQLALDIDILWTGAKVISKVLTQEQLHEITDVLRRPPVIWDNIHANDYDQKRVFLGPYSGRSPEIIPLLRGVLTNPNCEFHANAVAIHTLAHWSRCRTDSRRIEDSLSSAVDVRVERDGGGSDGCDGGGDEDETSASAADSYHPRVALRNAIRDWLPEFFRSKESYGPISKPHPAAVAVVMPVMPIIPSVNTCMSLTTTSTTTTTTASSSSAVAAAAATTVAEVNSSQLQALAEVCSVVTGTDTITLPNVVMNSLVSSTTIVTNTTIRNPIVSAGLELALPTTIPVPVSSVGIPIANVSGGDYRVKVVAEVQEEEEEVVEEDAAAAAGRQDEPMAEVVVELAVEPKLEALAGTRLNGAAVDDLMSVAPHIDIGAGEPMEVSGLLSPKLSASKAALLLQQDDVVMAESGPESGGGALQTGDLPTASLTAVLAAGRPLAVASSDAERATALAAKQPICAEDISLMCDLFYLPFEHGSRALRLLNEFNWLKANAAVLVNAQPPYRKELADRAAAKPEVQEWFQRADGFAQLGRSVLVLAKKLALCENRELAYELFAYVWDIAGVVTLLMGFVEWLALGCFPATINSYTQGSYTWFSKGWRETFTSGDQEPWVFRGGLTADLQRLIPVDSGNDLFLYKLPDTPSTSFPLIRPYIAADQPHAYRICHRTCRDGSDCTDLFPAALQSIPADRLIGPFVTLTPELCLVVVDGDELIGYACAALDAKHFYRQQAERWMPAMCAKYPLALLEQPEPQLTPTAAESIRHFHHFKYDCPQAVLASHPSMMTCCVLKEQFIADQSVAKRLVTVLLAALRANGSSGVHACINGTDRFLHQFYAKLGFAELHQEPGGKAYMGRNF